MSERVEEVTIPWPRLWTHLRLSWEVTRRAPDVLFVPAHVLPIAHPARTVVTIHDLGYLHHPEAHTRGARYYLEWSTRFNARQASHIIADSESTRRDLLHHYGVPAGRISVVYPGGGTTDPSVVDPGDLSRVKKRYGLPAKYLLYVGTIQPRKNLERLLEAYALLAQSNEGDDLGLVIAGKKGWLFEGIYRRATELGLGERVVFPGYVETNDLPALMSAATAFVLPSLYEGFSLPVLEAMSYGTPVICSNVSALPEVVGDAAWLVDPLNVGELAEAMRRVASDEKLRGDLRQRGFEQAARFSWDRCAREVLDVIEMVGRS